jgi:hypothetical protein
MTPRQYLYVALVLALLAGGWYFRDLVQTKKDFKNVQSQVTTLQDQDKAVAEKLRTEAIADAQRGRAINRRDEAARHDQSYQDYLDSPIPEQSLRLYRDAAKVCYAPVCPDRADAGGN